MNISAWNDRASNDGQEFYQVQNNQTMPVAPWLFSWHLVRRLARRSPIEFIFWTWTNEIYLVTFCQGKQASLLWMIRSGSNGTDEKHLYADEKAANAVNITCHFSSDKRRWIDRKMKQIDNDIFWSALQYPIITVTCCSLVQYACFASLDWFRESERRKQQDMLCDFDQHMQNVVRWHFALWWHHRCLQENQNDVCMMSIYK